MCKAYLCLFVCMSIKAVHLELVSDLSTPAFINAFKRFIARRGKCANIYSDNGSNFKGANKELRVLYNFITQPSNSKTIGRFYVEQAIQWHFISLYSPHMGGIWEARIKSAKTHLRRVLTDALVSFEEMYTMLTQVETILNSRPLTPVPNDLTDLVALTPGHFLIGASLMIIPEANLNDITHNRCTRFQYVSKLSQHFQTRCSIEYLSNLQQRFKWNREDQVSTINVGTMVILRDEQPPPMNYRCQDESLNCMRVVMVKREWSVSKQEEALLSVRQQRCAYCQSKFKFKFKFS